MLANISKYKAVIVNFQVLKKGEILPTLLKIKMFVKQKNIEYLCSLETFPLQGLNNDTQTNQNHCPILYLADALLQRLTLIVDHK